jgi:dienelactone hydrolase
MQIMQIMQISQITQLNSYTMKRLFLPFVLVVSAFFVFSCNDQPAEQGNEAAGDGMKEAQVKTDAVTYKDDTVSLNGMIAYDANDSSKRPGILVVPEWWGLVSFAKTKAEDLAKLGYVALAVDMYGNGKTADNPTDAGNLATPFYKNPQLGKGRIDAALNELKKNPHVDTSRLGAIGFCFGGNMIINAAKMGSDLDAIVSFHGTLDGPAPKKELLHTKFLVCTGDSDPFVPQQAVDRFKKQMDSVGADIRLIEYPGAKHAFTNPEATAAGKKFNIPVEYNAAADTASWKEMKQFFSENLK